MGKPTICICENKDADQLRGNREADQRLCFRYSDNTIPLLLKTEISSFWLFSVQAGLCRTCSETTLLVFPRGSSYVNWDKHCSSILVFFDNAPACHSVTFGKCHAGPSCSKLTTSLVNVSLKFQTFILQIHCYFLLKKYENPLQCKGFSHFFNKK